MLHLHLLLLLTFEILTLIAALFLLIHVNKQQLSKWYRHVSKTIVVILHVIILATLIHAIVYHFQARQEESFNHMEMYEKHHGEDGHYWKWNIVLKDPDYCCDFNLKENYRDKSRILFPVISEKTYWDLADWKYLVIGVIILILLFIIRYLLTGGFSGY